MGKDVKGKKYKALTRTKTDRAKRRLFVDTLLTKVMTLIIEDTKKSTKLEKTVIRIFLSILLISYKSNAVPINRYF